MVESKSVQAITINKTANLNVRLLSGCLYMLLLNIFPIISEGLILQQPHNTNNYTSSI